MARCYGSLSERQEDDVGKNDETGEPLKRRRFQKLEAAEIEMISGEDQ